MLICTFISIINQFLVVNEANGDYLQDTVRLFALGGQPIVRYILLGRQLALKLALETKKIQNYLTLGNDV